MNHPVSRAADMGSRAMGLLFGALATMQAAAWAAKAGGGAPLFLYFGVLVPAAAGLGVLAGRTFGVAGWLVGSVGLQRLLWAPAYGFVGAAIVAAALSPWRHEFPAGIFAFCVASTLCVGCFVGLRMASEAGEP